MYITKNKNNLSPKETCKKQEKYMRIKLASI